MKKAICIIVSVLFMLGGLTALALPKDDLPSHLLPFERLVGDNGDYDTKAGDWPEAGTYNIVVDVTNQIVTVYKTETGEIARQCLCSTGTKKTPTPVGTFKMDPRSRARFRRFRPKDEDSTWGQYLSMISEQSFFHSVLYQKQDANTYTGSYSLLGKRASHGCIRLPVPDARWIYFNVAPGTEVTITEDLSRDRELVKSLALPKMPRKRPKDLSRVPQIFADSVGQLPPDSGQPSA